MFYLESDASKAGLVTLMRLLHGAGFTLFDCQQTTSHMLRFGGFEMRRSEFLSCLERALKVSTPRGPWSLREGALVARDPDTRNGANND